MKPSGRWKEKKGKKEAKEGIVDSLTGKSFFKLWLAWTPSQSRQVYASTTLCCLYFYIYIFLDKPRGRRRRRRSGDFPSLPARRWIPVFKALGRQEHNPSLFSKSATSQASQAGLLHLLTKAKLANTTIGQRKRQRRGGHACRHLHGGCGCCVSPDKNRNRPFWKQRRNATGPCRLKEQGFPINPSQ